MLATSIVNVALPQIRTGVGLSDGSTTWVVNAYGLAFGALLLADGRPICSAAAGCWSPGSPCSRRPRWWRGWPPPPVC
ncbi:hypothetical protein ACFQ0M_02250 [Kitasatospora aburaviensis]